ncbi:hypothetical protein BP6252_00058 [Coleophoma cylindrospora]|uniref:Uncharacterized protein n=1 Tax=Coleophoma cylindrospora TaxID=1849047 RepID=A0A3D8SP06_9HELO|nr:hypothetical protein BP6252_00058 [Coleophoma cylindrospora]
MALYSGHSAYRVNPGDDGQTRRSCKGGQITPQREALALPPSPDKTPASKTKEIRSPAKDCKECLPALGPSNVTHNEHCVQQAAELLMVLASDVAIEGGKEDIAIDGDGSITIESDGDTEVDEDAPYQYPEPNFLGDGRIQYNSSNYKRLEIYADTIEAAYNSSTAFQYPRSSFSNAFQAMKTQELERKQREEAELRIENTAKRATKKKISKSTPAKGTPEERLMNSCLSEKAEDIEKFFAEALPKYWATGIANFDQGLAEQIALRDAEFAKHAHIDPRVIDCRQIKQETLCLPSSLKNLVIAMEPKHQLVGATNQLQRGKRQSKPT